jgi:succinyl-CoA synthetase beta subunit
MKIHEYQAKEILKTFGMPLLESHPCFTLADVRYAVAQLGQPVVVKAQIHAGGRGKAGGVKVAKTAQEAEHIAQRLLGSHLATAQSGAEGQPVNCVLLETACDIADEFYLSFLLDREKECVCVMASAAGGMDIEHIAATEPHKIAKEWVDPAIGILPYQARNLAYFLKQGPELTTKIVKLIPTLYDIYNAHDASLLELNPLVSTKGGELFILDAKMDFDDNALYRQPKITAMRDPSQEDSREVKAQHFGLSYIALDGNIGCMVNGAGLAMATMDIIKYEGGKPANFLDVGGSASREKVTAALKIILEDPQVKAVLINVFGGIAKCDVIAAGVISAAKEVGLNVPLVVRLEGTHVNEGKAMLAASGLSIVSADNLQDAAKKAVRAVG